MVVYQKTDYNYVKDRGQIRLFESKDELEAMVDDMFEVLKTKKTITKDKYTIEKGMMASVTLKMKGAPRDYTFTKYALKLFKKEF